MLHFLTMFPTWLSSAQLSFQWSSTDACLSFLSHIYTWTPTTPALLYSLFLKGGSREGSGNPLQCSCLENPRDGAAWWAAVYGITQSRTRLKWLSSSSSKRRLTSILLRRWDAFSKGWVFFMLSICKRLIKKSNGYRHSTHLMIHQYAILSHFASEETEAQNDLFNL